MNAGTIQKSLLDIRRHFPEDIFRQDIQAPLASRALTVVANLGSLS